MLGISANSTQLSEICMQWKVEVAFNAANCTPYIGIMRYLKTGYFTTNPCKHSVRCKGSKLERMFYHGCSETENTSLEDEVLRELEAVHNEEHADSAPQSEDVPVCFTSPERTDNRFVESRDTSTGLVPCCTPMQLESFQCPMRVNSSILKKMTERCMICR